MLYGLGFNDRQAFSVMIGDGGCVGSNNDTFYADFVNFLHTGICVVYEGVFLSVYYTGRSKVLGT